MKLYYKIEYRKSKELKSAFNQLTLKAKFDDTPRILRNGILYTLSKVGFIMYKINFLKNY